MYTRNSYMRKHFHLWSRIIILSSFKRLWFLSRNEKCSFFPSHSCTACIQKWKDDEYHSSRGNFSSAPMCDSTALSYGHLMDNVALIQLQMNRQDPESKWGGGTRCMNYAYYITISLQYTMYQNNAVKIGLRLRYWTISSMVLAYHWSEIALSCLYSRRTHARFVCSCQAGKQNTM